jgi:hypothetical protein
MLALGSSNSSVPCQWGALSLLCAVRISYLTGFWYAQRDCQRGSKSAAAILSSNGCLLSVISTPVGKEDASVLTSKYSYFVSSRTKGVDLNQARA